MSDKFQAIAKKRNAAACERKITEEIENCTEAWFSNEGNLHTNQQAIGMRELLRGLVAKALNCRLSAMKWGVSSEGSESAWRMLETKMCDIAWPKCSEKAFAKRCKSNKERSKKWGNWTS